MLLVDDSAKQILEEHGVPYGTYATSEDIFLTALVNLSLETAIKYNDADPANPEFMQKYVDYIRQTDAVAKCVTKIEKLEHDILNIICERTEGKHDEIIKAEPKVDPEPETEEPEDKE